MRGFFIDFLDELGYCEHIIVFVIALYNYHTFAHPVCALIPLYHLSPSGNEAEGSGNLPQGVHH